MDIQPADSSQSQKQDNGIGMSDFNFPAWPAVITM